MLHLLINLSCGKMNRYFFKRGDEMQKIKNAFYEHRFGLFFFGIFMLFGLVILDPVRMIEDHGVTYSFYCVDFSFGFCTKLLPGAIYKLLVGEYNEVAISVYVKTLIVIVFAAISILFEKLLKNKPLEERRELFFFLSFATVVIYFTFFESGLAYLLDFHWIISTLLILICLSNKKLYIFIPVGLAYAIMTHYISIICYVAGSLLILLYKAYIEENKKEKIFLFSLFVFSTVLSAGLFIYMLIFELDNLSISYPQMMSVFKNRGVGQTDYYRFAFFRDLVEKIFPDLYTDETMGWISDIDQNQPMIKILIDTVIQQFRINSYLSDHTSEAPKIFVFIPGIIFMMGNLIQRMKSTKFFEKLIYIAGIALFVFICVFGLVFSTDTLRWLGNAMLTFIIFYISVIGYEKNNRIKTNGFISGLPNGAYFIYLMLCVVFPLI